jgi:hypothetical protein
MSPADRIVFAGNPWPEGHAIARFEWTADIRDGQVWFGFHLESANYYAEREGDDLGDEATDWQAPIVWDNYHRARISSTYWHRGGFVVCALTD